MRAGAGEGRVRGLVMEVGRGRGRWLHVAEQGMARQVMYVRGGGGVMLATTHQSRWEEQQVHSRGVSTHGVCLGLGWVRGWGGCPSTARSCTLRRTTPPHAHCEGSSTSGVRSQGGEVTGV